MPISLFSFIDIYRRHIDIVAHLLTKGVAFAEAQQIAESDLLGWRLADDMNPLTFQMSWVINFAQTWSARAAGLPEPANVPEGLDVAGYQAALAGAKTWLATLTPEQFTDRDDVALTCKIGPVMEETRTAAHWLSTFAATNIAFHSSMVYAILRMKGVPLGKLDVFPNGL